MATYLVTFKPASENPEKGWPEESLAALALQVKENGVATEPWRFSKKYGVKVGERVFLIRQGKKNAAVLGYGHVSALPDQDKMTGVSFEALVNPFSGAVLATTSELLAIPGGGRWWRTQSSGVTLPTDISLALEKLVVGRDPVPDESQGDAQGGNWTDQELRAAVQAYLEMLTLVRSGKPFVKKTYYKALSKKFGRTEKAFEYRAQNISHVLALQGREWLPGLAPAKNVGAHVASKLEAILSEEEGTQNEGTVAFEAQVQALRKSKNKSKPKGEAAPKSTTTQVTTYIRDAAVKAWVLDVAKGICECCEKPGPFAGTNDEPFLEVHHVRRLADKGADQITNAVALCPNCHRALHHAIDRRDRIEALYKKLKRLVR